MAVRGDSSDVAAEVGVLLASCGRRGAAQTPRVFGTAPPNTD